MAWTRGYRGLLAGVAILDAHSLIRFSQTDRTSCGAHHGGAANPVSFVQDGDDLLNEYRLGGVSCRYDVLDGEVFGERCDAGPMSAGAPLRGR